MRTKKHWNYRVMAEKYKDDFDKRFYDDKQK